MPVRPGALASVLQTLPFFAVLRDDERLRIAARIPLRRLEPGATLTVAADAPALVIVVDGHADLAVDGGAPVPLFAGDMLGELDVLTGRGADERLTAVAPTTVATLDRAAVDALLADFPAIAPTWVAELARELRWRNDLLRELSLAHAEGLPPAVLSSLLRRRRRNLQRHRRSPLRRATARMARALFTVPAERPSFWVLVGAIAALAVARTVVAVIIANGLQKHLFALIGGKVGHPIHVHHFNYGLLLVALAGVMAMLPSTRRAIRRLAFVFGFGVGLIVDEFALLWNLNPDYYQPSSRLAAGLVLLAIVQVVYFRNLYLALGRRLLAMVRE